MKKIVYYVNQFYGQIGSRSSADGCREWGDVSLGRIFAFCRTCR